MKGGHTALKLAAAVAGAAIGMGRRRTGSTITKKTASVRTRRAVKRRSGSRTVTRRRRTKETDAPAGEYTRQTVARGAKPQHTLRAAWKLLGQNIQSSVYGYRNYGQFAGTTGAIQLLNTSPTALTGPFVVPMHLWEVTCAPNYIGGALSVPTHMWTPVFSAPSGGTTMTWNNTVGVMPTPILSLEGADVNNADPSGYPQAGDTLEWIQAKMVFYCPTALPCRYQIDVVQLKDTRLVPDGTATTPFRTAFWQAAVKRFAYNPLEGGDTKYQKYFKTLYSQTFILNPKETTESVNTIFREVNLFMRLNRRTTYSWEDTDIMNTLGVDGQFNSDGTFKTNVHPRARIFLMIRAQANNAVAFTSTLMPSYDLVMRVKHSRFD